MLDKPVNLWYDGYAEKLLSTEQNLSRKPPKRLRRI